MSPLLAQLTPAPDPQIAWNVILTLGVLSAIVVGVLNLVLGRKTKVEPDPLRVQKVENLVTKDYCLSSHTQIHQRLDGHDAAISDIRKEMKHDREQSDQAARVRSAGQYKKLDDLRRELSEKQDQMSAKMEIGFRDLERAIGQLEGRNE